MRREAKCWIQSVTVFDTNEAFDEAGQRLHLRRLGDAGVCVNLAASGSGEGYALSLTEMGRLFEVAHEELKGKVPLRGMGCEPRTTKQQLEFARAVEAADLDSIHIFSLDLGHAAKPTERELEAYFSTILASTSLPAVVSSHQAAGYLLPIPLVARLVDRFENVAEIQCATDNLEYLVRLIDTIGERVPVVSGSPRHTLTNLALGGGGYMCSEGNLAPRLCAAVVASYNAGDYDAAQRHQATLLRLYTANAHGSSVRAMKAALKMLGLPGGEPRHPRIAEDAAGAELVAAFESLGLHEFEGVTAQEGKHQA
jgi:4-hydroxy-tetrahydrodipicolinate synthase